MANRSLFSLVHIGLSIHHFNKKSEKLIGLSLVQWCLLRHLIDMPGISAFALAKTAGVHPSSLTQTLKRLERKGLVFIGEDPKDSRKKLISITRNGKNVLNRAEIQIQELSRDLASHDNELRRINTFLKNQVNKEHHEDFRSEK